MTPSSVNVNELARQVIAREVAGLTTPERLARGIEAAFRRLHELTSTLIGNVGFGAIVARAVHLTHPGCPCLATVEIHVDASFIMTGLSGAIEREGIAVVRGCAVDLFGNVLGLLCRFIGEDLTVRLVRRIWTDLPTRGAGAGSQEA